MAKTDKGISQNLSLLDQKQPSDQPGKSKIVTSTVVVEYLSCYWHWVFCCLYSLRLFLLQSEIAAPQAKTNYCWPSLMGSGGTTTEMWTPQTWTKWLRKESRQHMSLHLSWPSLVLHTSPCYLVRRKRQQQYISHLKGLDNLQWHCKMQVLDTCILFIV